MNKFEEQYVELVAFAGKLPKEHQEELVRRLSDIEQAHDDDVKELRSAQEEEIKKLEDEKDKELAELQEELEHARDQVDEDDAINVSASLQCLWRHSDGRHLIERAFDAHPRQTSIELEYMGAHDIAGEIRINAEIAGAKTRANLNEVVKDATNQPPTFEAPEPPMGHEGTRSVLRLPESAPRQPKNKKGKT